MYLGVEGHVFYTSKFHFPGGRREIHPDRIGISKRSADSSSGNEMNIMLAPFGAGRGPTTTAIQLSNSNQFDSINQPTACARQLQKLRPPRQEHRTSSRRGWGVLRGEGGRNVRLYCAGQRFSCLASKMGAQEIGKRGGVIYGYSPHPVHVLLCRSMFSMYFHPPHPWESMIFNYPWMDLSKGI